MQRLLASASGSGPIVLIGTDIPGVAPGHIAQAFARLGGHDAVFGPAEDGGYWLVGLRRCPRLLRPFAGVRWSSPHALADTVANLARARVAMVATLSDVDTARDHARLGPVAAQLIAPLSRISEKRPRGFRQ